MAVKSQLAMFTQQPYFSDVILSHILANITFDQWGAKY